MATLWIPSKIYFSQCSIAARFAGKSKRKIGETLDDLIAGKISVSKIPPLKIGKHNDRWYSMDNRRLWLFRKLHKLGLVNEIPVKVVSKVDSFKLTTRSYGDKVIVRGDPGGKVWKELEQEDSKCRTDLKPKFVNYATSASVDISMDYSDVSDYEDEDDNWDVQVGYLPTNRGSKRSRSKTCDEIVRPIRKRRHTGERDGSPEIKITLPEPSEVLKLIHGCVDTREDTQSREFAKIMAKTLKFSAGRGVKVVQKDSSFADPRPQFRGNSPASSLRRTCSETTFNRNRSRSSSESCSERKKFSPIKFPETDKRGVSPMKYDSSSSHSVQCGLSPIKYDSSSSQSVQCGLSPIKYDSSSSHSVQCGLSPIKCESPPCGFSTVKIDSPSCDFLPNKYNLPPSLESDQHSTERRRSVKDRLGSRVKDRLGPAITSPKVKPEYVDLDSQEDEPTAPGDWTCYGALCSDSNHLRRGINYESLIELTHTPEDHFGCPSNVLGTSHVNDSEGHPARI